jgi:DNA-binding PadR family transcriptional regulator
MGRRPGYATIAVLRALAEGACYGLDIMERTGLPSGTVYPVLSRLEEQRMLRGRWESRRDATAAGRPRRRNYVLTASGRAELQRMLAELRELSAPLPATTRVRPEAG